MTSPFKTVWLKAAIAFQIPFFTALGGALTPYVLGGAAIPQSHWLRVALIVVVISACLVAGYSGLSSFLSTSYSEHKDKLEAGRSDTDPAPISAAQAASPPIQPNTPPAAAQPKKE